jgi:hypothetical protein
MNLTISLDETQTAHLQRQARSRQIAPEQLARDLLGTALNTMLEDEKWEECNRRRVELIHKSRAPGLTADEATKLDLLQSAVDQRLAPMDRQLLRAAEEMRRIAEGLPDEPSP